MEGREERQDNTRDMRNTLASQTATHSHQLHQFDLRQHYLKANLYSITQPENKDLFTPLAHTGSHHQLEAREPGGESPLICGFVAVTVTLNYLRHWYLRDHSDGRFAAIVDYNDETDMVTITVGIVTRPGDDWESVDFTIDPDYQYFDSPRSHQTETVPQLRNGRNVHANYRVSDIENYIRREGHHIQGSIENHEFKFRVDYVISRR
ncbi:hypothetical protein Ptr902_11086 [Pyrenophora tritici-repentis]|nr:hypothetical protein Ptr902_11086 [Pyrenophora tritici-repentis]